MRYKAILLDGRHLLFRVASMMKGLTSDSTAEGMPTGGIYGFIKAMLSIYEDHAHKDAILIVCWEGGATERRGLDPEYKMGERAKARLKVEEDVIMRTLDDQMKILQGVLSYAGIRQAYSPGWEADDTMGTLSRQLVAKDMFPVAIYSGDYDMHQCVTSNVHVVCADRNPHNRGPDVIWDIPAVVERWGCAPIRVIEHKALAGDTGDNYHGCPGIGDVWARKLLQAYGSLPEMIAAAETGKVTGNWDEKDWSSETVAAKLLKGADQISLCEKLATINTFAPIKFRKTNQDVDKLKDSFVKLSFTSLLRPTVLAQLQKLSE